VAAKETLADVIRARAMALGFDLVGFAAAGPFAREAELVLASLRDGRLEGMRWFSPDRVRLSCDPERLLPGAQSIIALGVAYAQKPPALVPDGRRGRVARYAWGRDYHDVIRPKLRTLADTIVAETGPATRCRWFVDTGPFVDRAAAERAGLGFIGKNTCVLTGQHGSLVFLSAILTTAHLEPDPVGARDCGSCRLCLDACPTGALTDAFRMDATRCISYLTIEHRGWIPRELRPQMGDWVFGCDVCQDVCPWNRARSASSHEEFAPDVGAGETLDLPGLLRLDDRAFRDRFRGTPLTRPKRRGILRNAAIALGNARDPSAAPALIEALCDPDPVVRGHAAWALGQIQPLADDARTALDRALAVETDTDARAEIEAALGSAGPRGRG